MEHDSECVQVSRGQRHSAKCLCFDRFVLFSRIKPKVLDRPSQKSSGDNRICTSWRVSSHDQRGAKAEMKFAEIYDLADRAIAEGKCSELLLLSEKLISSGDESAYPSGYMLKGMAYEIGGDGVNQDFEKAISCYRQAAYLQPDTLTYVSMARAMMKQGPDSYSSALKYLNEAKNSKYAPELDIAFGQCYESAPKPDYELAKTHYLRAAVRGRFHGFFGYSSVSRKMGQQGRALLADCVRVAVGPFLFLLLGKRASGGI
jgi:tetratricopeptide (TPR) repeat protein